MARGKKVLFCSGKATANGTYKGCAHLGTKESTLLCTRKANCSRLTPAMRVPWVNHVLIKDCHCLTLKLEIDLFKVLCQPKQSLSTIVSYPYKG